MFAACADAGNKIKSGDSPYRSELITGGRTAVRRCLAAVLIAVTVTGSDLRRFGAERVAGKTASTTRKAPTPTVFNIGQIVVLGAAFRGMWKKQPIVDVLNGELWRF